MKNVYEIKVINATDMGVKTITATSISGIYWSVTRTELSASSASHFNDTVSSVGLLVILKSLDSEQWAMAPVQLEATAVAEGFDTAPFNSISKKNEIHIVHWASDAPWVDKRVSIKSDKTTLTITADGRTKSISNRLECLVRELDLIL